MQSLLPVDPSDLEAFCRRHHVRKLSVFGSRLKGSARPDSDFDVLVEFAPTAKPSFLDLASMEEELSGMLGGQRVDIRTPPELSSYFRDEVLRSARVEYVAG